MIWSEDLTRETSVLPEVVLWLVTTFLLGLLSGWCIWGNFSQVAKPSLESRWERLVKKALHFVGRRRRISLAFNSYKDHRLRTGVDKEPKPKRRAATPGVLHEGFAIRHGSARRRAGADQQLE